MTSSVENSVLKSKSLRAILLLGTVNLVSLIADDITMSAGLIGFVTFLSLVAAIPIAALVRLVKYGFFSKFWLPSALGLLFLLSIHFFVPLVHYYVYDWRFKWDYEAFTQTVEDIKNGVIPTSASGSNYMHDANQIKHMPPHIEALSVQKCNHGTVVVVFTGRSVRQGGYLFDDCDDPAISIAHGNGDNRTRNLLEPIQGPWYEFR